MTTDMDSRKMKTMILSVMILMYALPTLAQTGLGIASVFGRYQGQKNTVEVYVKGRKLKQYNLTMFRSMTIKDDEEALYSIENTVKRDGQKAADSETGMIGRHLYYGFYRFAQVDGKYRYLFFRNTSLRKPQTHEAVLIYMEGYATMDELKQMFK